MLRKIGAIQSNKKTTLRCSISLCVEDKRHCPIFKNTKQYL